MGTGSAAGGTGGVPDSRGRQGAVSFACLWILLACCTIRQQPPVQTDFEGYARFVTTSECLFSHLLTSIGGAALAILGVLRLRVVGRGRFRRAALIGTIMRPPTTWSSPLTSIARFSPPNHQRFGLGSAFLRIWPSCRR